MCNLFAFLYRWMDLTQDNEASKVYCSEVEHLSLLFKFLPVVTKRCLLLPVTVLSQQMCRLRDYGARRVEQLWESYERQMNRVRTFSLQQRLKLMRQYKVKQRYLNSLLEKFGSDINASDDCLKQVQFAIFSDWRCLIPLEYRSYKKDFEEYLRFFSVN